MNTSSQGYQRQYLTKSFTYQHFFCILIWYLILALPFYFSFGDQKFWQKPKNQMLNLQYNYTGHYAIQVNFVENNQFSSLEYSNIVGSSLNSLNSLTSFTVNDQNQLSTIQFKLSNFAQKVVQDINVILYYKLWISELSKEISTAWVQNIKGDLSYAQMSGIVRYQPETQINNIDNRLILNYPAYLPNLKPPTSFDFLIDHIIENSQVHRLNHQLTKVSATAVSSAQRKFKITLIKDTNVNVPYYPSVLETLKFAFLKWLAFVIIAYFVFYKLMEKLVKDGALVTKVKDELVPVSGTR